MAARRPNFTHIQFVLHDSPEGASPVVSCATACGKPGVVPSGVVCRLRSNRRTALGASIKRKKIQKRKNNQTFHINFYHTACFNSRFEALRKRQPPILLFASGHLYAPSNSHPSLGSLLTLVSMQQQLLHLNIGNLYALELEGKHE